MRIAMVHASFAVAGGAERYLRDLAAGLTARGHEVAVFSLPSAHTHPGDRPVRARAAARLGVGPVLLRKVATHLGDLIDPTGLGPADLRGFRPDTVHVHNWQGLGILPVGRLARAYPTCHTMHDYAMRDPNNVLAHAGSSAVVDRLLALRSAWIAGQLRRVVLHWPTARARDLALRGVPGAARLRGLVIPLAIPPGLLHRSLAPGRRDTLLYLGALSSHKGVDLLLEAWRTADPAPGRLLIAGDGPLRGAVQRLADVDDSVRYLGYLDAEGKRAALEQAAWLVFPSQCAETFGISCVEALLAGRPIVTSELASPPMASAGSTLSFGTARQLHQVLRRAVWMPDEEYRAMAASAAADGAALDWDRHLDAVLDLYRAAAGPAVPGRPADQGTGR